MKSVLISPIKIKDWGILIPIKIQMTNLAVEHSLDCHGLNNSVLL